MTNYAYIMRKPDDTFDHFKEGFPTEHAAEEAAIKWAREHNPQEVNNKIDNSEDVDCFNWETIVAARK